MRIRTFAISMCVLVLAAGFQSGCKKAGKSEESAPANTKPIADLIKAGSSPISTGGLVRGVSPVMPTFRMTAVNVSDAPVKLFNGTLIFFDEGGKALADTISESGYTDLSPIDPGATIELSLMTPNEKAQSGKFIIKDVIYEKPNPLGKEYGNLSYKWTNPNHDAALEAEKKK